MKTQENLECEILTRENEGDAIEEENYDEEECDAETDLFEVSSNENKPCCDKTLINSVVFYINFLTKTFRTSQTTKHHFQNTHVHEYITTSYTILLYVNSFNF